MLNKASAISSVVDLVLHYWNYAEHAVFAITGLGKQDMILSFTWLWEHNPKVDWAQGKVREECWAEVQEHVAIQACHASHLHFVDLDLLDPLPLALPCIGALYKDNQSSGGALGEELGGEFRSICNLELLDKAVEVGDKLYATLCLPPSITEIWASQTTSQKLAQAFAANSAPWAF
ncbi:hypothetical protein C0989_011820 [Termitomyces sp. Mn162]|nr:hypothetical protein C0989_011820 [Termitomyces sp. Mn162]